MLLIANKNIVLRLILGRKRNKVIKDREIYAI